MNWVLIILKEKWKTIAATSYSYTTIWTTFVMYEKISLDLIFKKVDSHPKWSSESLEISLIGTKLELHQNNKIDWL